MNTTLRKVGGSVMMTIPAPILERLHLKVGSAIEPSMDRTGFRAVPTRPRYTLAELLAESDGFAPDRAWLESGPAGEELL